MFGDRARDEGVILCQWCGSPDTRIVGYLYPGPGANNEVTEYRCQDCGKTNQEQGR